MLYSDGSIPEPGNTIDLRLDLIAVENADDARSPGIRMNHSCEGEKGSRLVLSGMKRDIEADVKAADRKLDVQVGLDVGRDEESLLHSKDEHNRQVMYAVATILAFSTMSGLVILSNKYIITDLGFQFPISLSFWHLLVALLATQYMKRCTPYLPCPILDRKTYISTQAPIAVLFALKLLTSNLPYVAMSVAFMEMTKGLAPVITLFAAYSMGLETPSVRCVIQTLVIVAGVVISSLGEINFVYSGMLFQVAGLFFNSYRLCLTRKLVVGENKLTPLQALYFMAPPGVFLLAILAAAIEWRTLTLSHVRDVGLCVFLLNAGMAFTLNILFVAMVQAASPLTVVLSGYSLSLCVMVFSTIMWSSETVTATQYVGYAISCVGLLCYSMGR